MRARPATTIRPQQQAEETQMGLLVVYTVAVLIGQSISVSIGLLVDRFYSPAVSVPIALALYFVMFWVAWRVAVRVTEPRPQSDHER
jgi:hypothetical protein